MAYNQPPRQIGISLDIKPHAYDPATMPEYFEGVLERRIIAFLVDLLMIALPVAALTLFIFLFGIVTLGLGWLLFWLISPLTVVWALLYYGLTLGGSASATIGMRVMDLEMRTWYGARSYFVLGAVHAIAFWATVSFLTPLVLLVCLLNARRRLLHDMLLGTVVVNTEARAQALRRSRPAGWRG